MRMKRGLVALVGAGLLLTSVPGSVGAARVSKFTDHIVAITCNAFPGDDFASAFVQTGREGKGAQFDLWLAPADPSDFDQRTATGTTDADSDITVDEHPGGVDISVDYIVFDPSNGDDLGNASLTASMSYDGAPFGDGPGAKSNHHSSTTVVHQPIAGEATLTALDHTLTLSCSGDITDLDVHESNPTSFVNTSSGTQLDCFWETGDTFAGLNAFADEFGFGANAFLVTPASETFNLDSSGSMDSSGIDASMNLSDAAGDPNGEVATAVASFSPDGDPVTSYLIQTTIRVKQITQPLAPDGSLDFSTGESFPIDGAHCSASSFVNKVIVTAPKGPKPGQPPSNDTPDGAIAIDVGSILNVQTTSTAVLPEVEITTCPEGDRDNLGHTLWYTFQGTGDAVTIDPSGSNFDTVVAVYTRDGDAWTEVGCNDDAEGGLPLSYQGKLTVPTDEGVTYYIQAGGFRWWFEDAVAQSGRLRLAIY
jgi:hypothetical protein